MHEYIFSLTQPWPLYIHIYMQKHIQYNKDEEDTSLEKYTSHFSWKGSKGLLKVFLCERWVGDWTELQHIDPHSYGHSNVSFIFSWAAQPGCRGPACLGHYPHSSIFSPTYLKSNCSIGGPEDPLCWVLVLSTASYLQLTRTSCGPIYIIVLCPLNSTCRQSRYSLVTFERMHLLFTQVTLLFWQPGRGQYATSDTIIQGSFKQKIIT